MKLKLDKKNLFSFLQTLIGSYDLYAPVEVAEAVSVYKKIDDPKEVNPSLLNPQKPLKELLFPQSEVMFCYQKSGKKTQITSTEEVKRERVVFGARPCDIEAISLIEDVYCGENYSDVYFRNKRKSTTIIGMACDQPLSTCFCSATGGGPFVRKGSDLFFIDIGHAYLVELHTEKASGFKKNKDLKEASSGEIALAGAAEKKALETMEAFPGHGPRLDSIEKKLDTLVESSLWDRIHEKCIGCYACTFLCPSCHCFDLQDEAVGERGQRVRNWDSCLSSLYSLETSGHNPRPSGRERTRQRIMHKLNYFPKVFGRIACVGCGRCILYCPVNFDIRQTIEEINEEYKTQMSKSI